MKNRKPSASGGRKGTFGYVRAERKRRLLITLGLFAAPLLVLAVAWIYYGTRMNMWTILAVVGCLPACRSVVSLIMICRARPLDSSLYEDIRAHQGDLTAAYECYMTFYEKSAAIDAFAICGNSVVGYSSDPKIDSAFMAENAQALVRKNGYKADVKILTDLRHYLERLDSMNAHQEGLREGIRFSEDDRYPGMGREEVIRQILLSLCV